MIKNIQVLYEDNHVIAVNKQVSDIVQGDKTGDTPLKDYVASYLKQKYNKPGNVFVGVAHRLDRPTSGVLLFARTSKSLTRLNNMFKEKTDVQKTYWAIVKNKPLESEGTLNNYLFKDTKKNKSFVTNASRQGAKRAVLHYKTIAVSDNFTLLQIQLETGRHHQIRVQLSKIACPIKGDLKYGFPRSNPDAGISLHARSIEFMHPVKKVKVKIVAPVPDDKLWKYFEQKLS